MKETVKIKKELIGIIENGLFFAGEEFQHWDLVITDDDGFIVIRAEDIGGHRGHPVHGGYQVLVKRCIQEHYHVEKVTKKMILDYLKFKAKVTKQADITEIYELAIGDMAELFNMGNLIRFADAVELSRVHRKIEKGNKQFDENFSVCFNALV